MIDFGEGVELHALTREGIHQARAWRNDPRIYSWCRQNDAISDVAHERWFERQAADQTIKMYWVVADQRRVGVCGLTSIDRDNRRAEFSLYIAPEEQGRGYARAALKTLLSHGFRGLNLHLIWGESLEENPAIKLFRSLGFVAEGWLRDRYFKDGRYLDALMFSITEAEWKAHCSPQSADSSEPSSAAVSVLGWTPVAPTADPPPDTF